MRRGIGFATFVAGLLSLLIVIVGSGVDTGDEEFNVQYLANTLEAKVGRSACCTFAVNLSQRSMKKGRGSNQFNITFHCFGHIPGWQICSRSLPLRSFRCFVLVRFDYLLGTGVIACVCSVVQ